MSGGEEGVGSLCKGEFLEVQLLPAKREWQDLGISLLCATANDPSVCPSGEVQIRVSPAEVRGSFEHQS